MDLLNLLWTEQELCLRTLEFECPPFGSQASSLYSVSTCLLPTPWRPWNICCFKMVTNLWIQPSVSKCPMIR